MTLDQFSQIILRSLIDDLTKSLTRPLLSTTVKPAPARPKTPPPMTQPEPQQTKPVFHPAQPEPAPVFYPATTTAPQTQPEPAPVVYHPATPAAVPQPVTPPAARPPSPPAQAATGTPHGLNNIGNSCFMNASLQSIYALDRLTNALLPRTDFYPPRSFAAEYVKFIQDMRNSSEKELAPRELCMRGWAKMGFNPLSQQDNDEFIVALLDDLIGTNQNDPINQLLEIQLQAFLGGKASARQNTVLLSVPPLKETLDQCLQAFFAEEQVEYAGIMQEKQERILRAGHYFIIHLKRNVPGKDPKGQFALIKIAKPIPFPLTNLDLNPYAIAGARLPLYRLKAFVVHAGSARGGHYTGYVRYGNNWFFVNDSAVTPVSQQAIEQIAKQGYGSAPDQTPTTFFYERM